MAIRKAVLAVMLLVFTVVTCCADLTGKWQWEMATSGGRTQYTLTLEQDGENLTGTLGGGEDAMPIREGKVSGDKLSFVVARRWGNRESTMTYQGRLFGDEIRFRVFMPGAERSWDVSAKRAP